MRRYGLACAALLALAGCRPNDLSWTFTVPAEIDASVRGLQAHVIPETCIAGPQPERPRETASYRFARGEPPPVPIRTLPPGRWGFEVEALDAECRPIGRACVLVDVPASSVLVPIQTITPEPSVCPGACEDGVCLGPGTGQDGQDADAGGTAEPDAGPDAGPTDAGSTDAGAPDSGGAADAGADAS